MTGIAHISQVNGQVQLSSEHVRAFDEVVVIHTDGTIKVTENILYDFGYAFRHGIFRTIPTIKTNSDGKKYRLDISDVQVRDEKGIPYNFTAQYGIDRLEVKIGDSDNTITGVHTYVISYQVSGALTYFSDHDELYWNVTGNEWTVPIVKTTSTVTLVPLSSQDLKVICYTGSFRSKEQNCISSGSPSKGEFTSTAILNKAEGMTVVVGFPKNLVAVVEPTPVNYFFDSPLGKVILKLIILLVVAAIIAWYIVAPIFIIVKWFKTGRDPKGTTGEVRAWFDPPKGKNGRFLTPAEVGGLIDETVNLRDVSATFIHLAQRGYMKIVEEEKGKILKSKEFSVVKMKEYDQDSQLQDFERELLDGLFKKQKNVKLKDAKLYKTVEGMKQQLYVGLVSQGFFLENPEQVRKTYYILGIVAFFTFNIPLGIIAVLFGKYMPRKTLTGVDAAAVGRSLHNFLSSQERQLEFQAKNQTMFEKLLPYAVAFGVEKIWAERFKEIDMKPPDWYESEDMSSFNSVLFASHLSSSFSSFQSAATPPSSVRSSSGFSSGFSSGGSSGGGGGGGGGGSW